jgi:uncharacterized protein (TIGR01777 family)
MRIAICGANGFIGTHISRALVNSGYEVVRIGREHFKNSDALSNSLDGCEVVINLCGAPIVKKWDEIYKHELYVSRIETTKKLIKEIEQLENKPSLFISASAIGIYKEDLVHDENSTEFGTSYLALLAKEWENEAKKVEDLGLRSVIFRLGVVLGQDGGAIEEFKLAFKIGLGAVPGDGKQPFSWVHIDDVVSVFKKAIEDTHMKDTYNLVAPESVNMKTFMTTFGKVINRPAWLNVPEAILKVRYGEGAESLLRGAFVVPTRLEKEGYIFKYNHLNKALSSVL